MRFRRSTLEDWSALLAIDHLAQEEQARRRWLREALKMRTVYVLTNADRIVAYAVLTRNFFGKPFVEMLYVAERERRKGYGEALLTRLEAMRLCAAEVWTSTNQSNRAMRALLKSRCFGLCGRVSGLDAGDSELFYVKRKR